MAMMKREESRHDFAFMAGVIIGAISGALATLALTPVSGSEAREKLRSQAESLGPVKERAASVASSAATSAQSLMSTGKDRASDMLAKAPLPIGGHREGDGHVADAQVTSRGFGVHGAHTEQPAEGAVNPVSLQDRANQGAHGAHTMEAAEGPRDASTVATPAAHDEIRGPKEHGAGNADTSAGTSTSTGAGTSQPAS